MSWHGVEQGLLRGEIANLPRDTLVERDPVVRFFIIGVKRLAAQIRESLSKRLYGRMYISAEVDGCAFLRGLRKTGLSLERQIVPTPWPKPDDGDCCCHASSSLNVRYLPVVYRERARVSNSWPGRGQGPGPFPYGPAHSSLPGRGAGVCPPRGA